MARTQRHSVKGYKIDFTNNTIIMNYSFAQAAQDFGSAEYNIIKAIREDYPTMQTVVKAGRKVTTTNKNKRFTYANMEKHIRCYENSDELLNQFHLAQALSQPLASPYKYVCDWFMAQFPNYRNVEVTIQQANSTLKVVALPNTANYEEKIYA